MDLYEVKVVVLVVKENFDLFIFCIMIFDEGGRSFIGCMLECMVVIIEGLGVDVIGVNCLLGFK